MAEKTHGNFEERFRKTCELVRDRDAAATASESDKRILYACYKIATVGCVPDVAKPHNYVKAQYWQAWERIGQKLDRNSAQEQYVKTVNSIAARRAEPQTHD